MQLLFKVEIIVKKIEKKSESDNIKKEEEKEKEEDEKKLTHELLGVCLSLWRFSPCWC